MKGKNNKNIKMDVEIRDIPEETVIYVRHIGPYKGNAELFGRLIGKIYKWAGAHNLINENTKLYAVYHDDPDVTDPNKLRLSICLTAPDATKVDGEVGKMEIPTGKYAVAHVEINVDEYEAAWNALMGNWFPESGYQPTDGICFEHYQNDPKSHPEGKHIVDLYVGVKPL